MPTEQELLLEGIYNWENIREEFDPPDLLLGNGFSMQFSGNFAYPSLFSLFLENCNEQYRSLFRQFNTTNFELILKYLTYTIKVNTALNLPTQPVIDALEELKNGLISTIEQVHPRAEDIEFPQLEVVAEKLRGFNNIFTTNYDLYLYHIIMLSHDKSKTDKTYLPYQDWFWGRHNAPKGFREFMDYQNRAFKHIYYLHGSLFIFKHGLYTIKLIKDEHGQELIESIGDEIRANSFPLFVSEGAGSQKKERIQDNSYLRFCLDQLEDSEKPVLVFGNAMAEFDTHILRALKAQDRVIIYSIYTHTRTMDEINLEKLNFLAKFNNYGGEVKFVNSSTVFGI